MLILLYHLLILGGLERTPNEIKLKYVSDNKFADLIGSLCDLTSGSGDKGTPVVFIQGYFDNLADE